MDKVILCGKPPLTLQEGKVELLLQDFLDELWPSQFVSMRKMGSRGRRKAEEEGILRARVGEGRRGSSEGWDAHIC